MLCLDAHLITFKKICILMIDKIQKATPNQTICKHKMTGASGGKSKCILCEKIIKKIFNCQEDIDINLLLKKKQHQIGLLKAKTRVKTANKIDVPKITLFKTLRGVEDNPCARSAFKTANENLTQAILLNKSKPKDVKDLEQIWIKLDKPIQSQKSNLKKSARRADKKFHDAVAIINKAANSVQEFRNLKKYTKRQNKRLTLKLDQNSTPRFVHMNKKEDSDEKKLLTKIETVVEADVLPEVESEAKNINKEVISKTKHNTLVNILNEQASSGINNRFKNTPIPTSIYATTSNKTNMAIGYWKPKMKRQNKRQIHKKSKRPIDPLYPPFQPQICEKTLSTSRQETKHLLTEPTIPSNREKVLDKNKLKLNQNVVVAHLIADKVPDIPKDNLVCGSDVFYVGSMAEMQATKTGQISNEAQTNERTEKLKLDMNKYYTSDRMSTYSEGNITVDNSERIGSDTSDVDITKYYASNKMAAFNQVEDSANSIPECGNSSNAYENCQKKLTTIYTSNNYNAKENTQESNMVCDRCQRTFYPSTSQTCHACHRMAYHPNIMKTYQAPYSAVSEEEPKHTSSPFYSQNNGTYTIDNTQFILNKPENVAAAAALPNIQTKLEGAKEITMIEDNPIKIEHPRTKLSLQMLLEEIQRRNRIDECLKCLQQGEKEAGREENMGTPCPPCPPPPPSCPPPCPDLPYPPACPSPAPKPTSCPPPDDNPPPKKCFQKFEKSDLLSLDPYYAMPNKTISLDTNLLNKDNQITEIIVDDVWKKLKKSVINTWATKCFGKHFNYFTTLKSTLVAEPFTREKEFDDPESMNRPDNIDPTVSLSPPICPPKPKCPPCPKPCLPPICPPKPKTCYPTPCTPRLPPCKRNPSPCPPKQPTCPKPCPQAKCKPKTCPPKPPICTPKAPAPPNCPPKKPNPCAPVCPPKPACPPKTPPCPPKTPTCPPKAPTCPPKAPTCPPPPCPPPCPPKPPACPPNPCCPKSCCSEVNTPQLLFHKLDNIISKPGFIIIPNENTVYDPPTEIFIPKEATKIAEIIINEILDQLNVSELNKWLVRGFEPWTPIPSWPIPQMPVAIKTPCEEKYCKRPTPPKLSDPCKHKPCTGFPKRSR